MKEDVFVTHSWCPTAPDVWGFGKYKDRMITDIIAQVKRDKDGSWHWRLFHFEHDDWGNEPSREEAIHSAQEAIKLWNEREGG